MSTNRQWLDLGLEALPAPQAQRVRLFRLLQVASGQMRARMDAAFAASGISTQQAVLLQAVQAQTTPPTLTQMAAALDMSHQNVKQLALVLQRKGFMQLQVDAHDKRVRRLNLTEHHHTFWRQREGDDFASVAAWSAGLKDADIDALVALLQALSRSLRAGAAGPTSPHS